MHRALLASSLVACACGATPTSATAPPTPAPPPLRALLVLHPLDHDGHAYVLACARREPGKPPAWIDAATCTPLLRGAPLELLGETAHALTAGAIGEGYPCPDGEAHQPFVAVAGVPADIDRGFVVTGGVAPGTPDENAVAAITARHPPMPDKRPRNAWRGAHLSIVGAYDVDGDGAAEIVTEHLGWYRVWRSDGELLGAVGCAYG